MVMCSAFILYGLLLTTPPVQAAKVPPAPPAKVAFKEDNGEPFVTLPATVEGKIGAYIPIKPLTNGKEVKYIAIDDGLNVFPAEMLIDKRSTVVSSISAGRYRLLAYTAVADTPSQPVITTIVVGNPPPVPPPNPDPPGPGPTPVPVRPTGLAGEMYDQLMTFNKTELNKVRLILDNRINNVAGKSVIVSMILSDMAAAGIARGGPWSLYISWMKDRLIKEWPDATDDQVVDAMKQWKIAVEALLK